MRIEIRHTIDLCRSEKGGEIRRNAGKLKAKFAKGWEEDKRFVNLYTCTHELGSQEISMSMKG